MKDTFLQIEKELTESIPADFRSSSQDIVNQAVLEVCDRELYAADRNLYLSRDRPPAPNGPLDLRLGISGKIGICETCGESLIQCNGHFGFVKLALPAFHIGYLKMVISVLQDICKVLTCAVYRELC